MEQGALHKLRNILIALILGTSAAISLVMRTPSLDGYASLTAFSTTILDTVSSAGAFTLTVLSLGIAYICYQARHAVSQQSWRNVILFAISSLILAASIVIPGFGGAGQAGFPWYSTGDMLWESKLFDLVLVFKLCSVGAVLYVVWCLGYERIGNGCGTRRIPLIVRWVQPRWRNILSLSAVVFVCWLPWMIIVGPAELDIDTMVQLIQVRGFNVWDPQMMTDMSQFRMTDHHPFADTYLYGFFDWVGRQLGNELIGFVVLKYLQAFVASLSLVSATVWVRRRSDVSDIAVFVVLVMIAFLPAFPLFMSTILKDSTWAPIFLFWLIAFAEFMYRSIHDIKVYWRLVGILMIVGIMAGLTKKTSVYVTAPVLLLAAFFIKNRWKAVASSLIPPLIVLIAIPGLLFPILNIAPGGSQEAISVPLQQMGKVVIDHRGELSSEELSIVNRVMKVDKIKDNFDLSTTDKIKSQTYRISATKEDRKEFLILWVKLFFRYPVSYITAVPYLRSTFIVGDTYYYLNPVKCGWYEMGGKNILPQYGECQASAIQQRVGVPMVNAVRRIPPFSLIGAEAVYTLWIPAASVALTIAWRKWRNLLYFLPVALLELVQFMIPAHQTRYSLGFLFSFMIIAVVAFIKEPPAEAGREPEKV